jgi:hypothetical protein
MFGGLVALAHLLRVLVEAALHGLQHMLMFPAGNAALLAGGALPLDGAALAGRGP